jgi:hypothetical protein
MSCSVLPRASPLRFSLWVLISYLRLLDGGEEPQKGPALAEFTDNYSLTAKSQKPHVQSISTRSGPRHLVLIIIVSSENENYFFLK